MSTENLNVIKRYYPHHRPAESAGAAHVLLVAVGCCWLLLVAVRYSLSARSTAASV